ncbi:polysaccharide deacetylase family protein [Rhodobacteraceae bacterium NNCM2]|nr:polysaccharide deacetylase family protein [Coraliihabitans acroporae]
MTHPGPERDLIGYGAAPPRAPWPNGARIAVNFCINYEEGAERSILNGDDGSEDRLSDVIVERRMGARDLNIESSYNFGSRVGYWRLLRAFTDRGLTATVNLVGHAGELVPDPLAAMIGAGFDLQLHGWRWIDHHTLTEVEERAHIQKGIDQVIRLTGERPLGTYAGLPSMNTRRLSAEMGFLYNSDAYDDERPYWSTEYLHPILIMPYSLETNDSRFARGEGYETADQFVTFISDSFDTLYAEGGTMLTIGLHARIIGRPGRIKALHQIFDHITAHTDVWIARRGDIARVWADAYPPD